MALLEMMNLKYISKIGVFCLIILFFSCQKEEISTIRPQKDAIFVYMIADNDLDFYATANMNEMESFIAENQNVGNIYLYIDRTKNRKTAHPILYQISADTTAKINSKILKVYPEKDSADNQVFKSVLNEINFISSSKNETLEGLILWSHGSAWLPDSSVLLSNRATAVKSFGLDQTTPNAQAQNSEMNIKQLAHSLEGYHFDFLLFDAYFMGPVEVFYELKNNFDYIIASPTEVLATGFPYKDILGEIFSKSTNYKKICEKYVAYFQQKNGVLQSASAVAIKTNELEKFANLVKTYFSENKENITTEKWLQYDQENIGYLFDLGDFISFLEEKQPEKALSDQLERLKIGYYHTDYFFNHINLQNSSGISIFVPQKNINNDEKSFYKTLLWSNDTNLSSFYAY